MENLEIQIRTFRLYFLFFFIKSFCVCVLYMCLQRYGVYVYVLEAIGLESSWNAPYLIIFY